MQSHFLRLTASFFVLLTMSASATVRYVDVNNPSPTPPYTNWATAAVTIQDAVDAAAAGDEVLVTNGVYQIGGRAVYGTMTNRVAVDKPLTVRSVNGPQFTVIRGSPVPGTTNGDGAIRCVYLTNGASLSGFTLTNGATRAVYDFPTFREASGGGLRCESTSVVVSNCVVVANSATERDGGAYNGTLYNCTLSDNRVTSKYLAFGGGVFQSTLNNCTLTANSSVLDAGGAMNSTLNNCVLSGNSAAENGGGASQSTLNNCTLIGNSGYFGGGASLGTLNNCTLNGNSALEGGGVFQATLNNCTLSSNSALFYGGGARYSTLNNCTLTGNSAGFAGGGTDSSGLNNCIVYYNAAPSGSNYSGGTLNYCCTKPIAVSGAGSFTNAPLFVDQAASNLRLQSNSPCINAGFNSYAPAGLDLAGNLRLVGGTVDVGAYEYQSPASVISYAWLQQYGLPINGSADFLDSDVDRMTNWQEWRAGTIPTNALSVLRLLNPTDNASGVIVSWQSVSGRSYFLERSTNLIVQPPFLLLKSNITGQAGTTTFMDTNAVGFGPFFYRVGVQE